MFISSYIVRENLKEWKERSGASQPIMFKTKDNVVTIYTSQVGYLIGKGGCLIDEYTNKIRSKCGENIIIELIETNYDVL